MKKHILQPPPVWPTTPCAALTQRTAAGIATTILCTSAHMRHTIILTVKNVLATPETPQHAKVNGVGCLDRPDSPAMLGAHCQHGTPPLAANVAHPATFPPNPSTAHTATVGPALKTLFSGAQSRPVAHDGKAPDATPTYAVLAAL